MMSMRNLEKRLEKLEQEYSPPEITVIMLTDFGEGEVKGWKGDDFYVTRNPSESEEAHASRAATETVDPLESVSFGSTNSCP